MARKKKCLFIGLKNGWQIIFEQKLMMYKFLFVFGLLSSPLLAAPLPDSAHAMLAEFAGLPKSAIVLRQNTLTFYTLKPEVSRRYAEHIIGGSCEWIALEPTHWLGVQFSQIEVRNHSRNQGYRLAITPKDCRVMIDKDLSDAEVERIYYKALRKF